MIILKKIAGYGISIAHLLFLFFVFRVWVSAEIANVMTSLRTSNFLDGLLLKDLILSFVIYTLIANLYLTIQFHRTSNLYYSIGLVLICIIFFSTIAFLNREKPENKFSGLQLSLVKAALKHNSSQVRDLVKSGAPMNEKANEWSKDTPLTYAIEKKDLIAVEILLNNGADVNLEFESKPSPLELAISIKSLPMLQLLLKYSPIESRTDRFINLGFNVVKSIDGIYAISFLELLFSNGIDVNSNQPRDADTTLLIEALSCKKYDLALWLIEKGANVRAVNGLGDSVANLLQQESDQIHEVKKIKAILQKSGVVFPVPTHIDFHEKWKKNGWPKSTINMNEQGEIFSESE